MFTLLTSIASGLLPLGHILSIQRTFVFLPFFIAGFYLQSGDLQRIRSLSKSVSVFALLVCFAFICILSYQYPDLIKMLRAATPYYQLSADLGSLIILRCVTIGLSFVISFSILSLYKISFFSSQGEKSIVYYLYHGLIIEFIILPSCTLLHVDNSVCLMLLSFIATAFVVVSIYFFSKNNVLYNLTNPVKCWLNKYPLNK